MTNDIRFSRQAGYVDPSHVQSIILAGCGSVGRQIGLALGAMGFADRLALWDHDTVGPENLSTQGWPKRDNGVDKAVALADAICCNADRPKAMSSRYVGQPVAEIVIMALDSIASRRTIAGRLASQQHTALRLLVDPRQSPTGCRIVCVDCDRLGWIDDYLVTLPTTPSNTGCVRPQTYFQSLITAGLACRLVARYSMGLPCQSDIVYDGNDGINPDLFPNLSPLAARNDISCLPPMPILTSV